MYRSHGPDYEAAFAIVRHLDNDTLKNLVNDDDAVADLLKNLDMCKEMERVKESFMTQNKSLAEYNLSLEPKLETEKQKLKELCDSVKEVWDTIKGKMSEIKEKAGDINSETALALLQTAAAESEEESEEIADKLYQKYIEMDEFLEQFQTVRRQMHLRRVKADKMKDLLQKKNTNNSANGPVTPYPKLPTVPYPVESYYMPRL